MWRGNRRGGNTSKQRQKSKRGWWEGTNRNLAAHPEAGTYGQPHGAGMSPSRLCSMVVLILSVGVDAEAQKVK